MRRKAADSSKATDPTANPQILTGSDAAFFQFHTSDAVTLTMIAAPSPDDQRQVELNITYQVKGTDPASGFKDAVSKIFPNAAPGAATKQANPQQSIAVTDNLFAGGQLIVTFQRTFRKVADGSTAVESQKIVTFRTADENPWFAATFGVVFSTARHPSVTLEKTNQVVTFTKDGKTQPR